MEQINMQSKKQRRRNNVWIIRDLTRDKKMTSQQQGQFGTMILKAFHDEFGFYPRKIFPVSFKVKTFKNRPPKMVHIKVCMYPNYKPEFQAFKKKAELMLDEFLADLALKRLNRKFRS
jgi:hypothetical protein